MHEHLQATMKQHLQNARGRLFRSPLPVAGPERRGMLAPADVTAVLLAGMTPPTIIRTVTAGDNFDELINAASSKDQYQDFSPPWSSHCCQQSPPYHRRASHRRLHAMDWDGIISTNQQYDQSQGVTRPNPCRTFEQMSTATVSKRRASRSSDFLSVHTTLGTQECPMSCSSQGMMGDGKVPQDNFNSSRGIPCNISELIANLNIKAKLLTREQDEYEDSSSLEYSSDDSVIEAAIYKSVAPHALVKRHQQSIAMKDLICAVCLDFPDDPKHIASVSGCHHRFCFECIEKWAKKGNHECPLCKSAFHLICSGNRVRWY